MLILQILKELLQALSKTEEIYERDRSKTPFLALTTLKALRLTIPSTIDLTEELFKLGFAYVLTAKLKQDCIEVQLILEYVIPA